MCYATFYKLCLFLIQMQEKPQKRRSHLFSDPTSEMLVQNGPSQTTILDTMVGVGDFVLLDPLTEDAFIENLKKRFVADNVYVRMGGTFNGNIVSLFAYNSSFSLLLICSTALCSRMQYRKRVPPPQKKKGSDKGHDRCPDNLSTQ